MNQRLALRERPDQPVVLYQKWQQLLFLHWQFDPDAIQATLPPGLTVDTYEGKGYVGIVPFYMRDVRPRFVPAVPGISNFLEVNVRTYVYDKDGNAGVWFYSLDANQWLAVKVARLFFKLPYFHAKMQAFERDGITYHTHRQDTPTNRAVYFQYRPVGQLAEAEVGSLSFFLAERYLLFAYDQRQAQLYSGRVWHPPYRVCEAKVPAFDTNLFQLNNLTPLSKKPVSALFSPGVAVDTFYLQPI